MITVKELKEKLSSGEYDEKLSYVYCCSTDEVKPYADRIADLAGKYTETFAASEDSAVVICSAPGRTELGGNHTDHQRGRVLTGAVDLDAIACAAPNNSSMIRIFSEGYGMTSVDCSVIAPVVEENGTTAAIIRGVAAKIIGMGYSVSGFNAYVRSDVPGGSGLSSSACFEVLVGAIVNELFCSNEINSAEIAKIGQYAENVYFGKPSGLLDQMGCSIGGIVAVDFYDKDNPKYYPVEFDFAQAGHALCIIDTGASHANMTDDYSAMPNEMKSVASFFGKEVLSQVGESEFYLSIPAMRGKVGDRAIMRAVHYYTDMHHVEKQIEALENKDFDTFLHYVNESGNSSFKYLENVDTYKDSRYQPIILALALSQHYLSGRGASRVHGGGLAGTIQVYVPLDMLAEFSKAIDAVFGEGACRVTRIRPVGGCTLAD